MAATGDRNVVTLGPRDRLVGQLHIEGDLLVGGTVDGGVEATGDIEIGDEARVNASVSGADVNIMGHVTGAVTARKRLMVASSGSLTGDVHVARLVVKDGATFSGNVSMGKPAPAAAPRSPEPSISEVQDGDGGKAKPGAGKGKPKR